MKPSALRPPPPGAANLPSPPVPVLPESAPFTSEQRAWLNGFIAGVMSRGGFASATAAVAAGRPAALRPLTICFGSQTGTAEILAKKAAKAAGDRGFAATVVDLGQISLARLAQEENLLVITSTYGEGEPPDNAKAVHAELMTAVRQPDQAPKLTARFSVLGLGDTNYVQFCRCAKDFDAGLEKLGGVRIAARVDCEPDYEAPASGWLHAALTALSGPAVPQISAAIQAQTPEPAAAKGYSRNGPYAAAVSAVRKLNGAGSAKAVAHVEFDLGDSGLVYEPGDALGVWPHNCPELVQEVLAQLRCDGEEAVSTPTGGTASFRRALTEHYDLGRPTADFAARFAAPTPAEPAHHIIDLLRLRPETTLAPTEFVRLLRPMAPRLYSIASSQRAHPRAVHLTVGTVGYSAHGRSRKGVCSTFLADRAVPAQSPVGIFVHRNAAFRLPASPEVPIIMVGPGTGIAPFRAFLQHRAAAAAPGKAWLFFGDQRAATDFLYREELTGWLSAGHLTRLDTAFSRDQEDKVYVQHRMREQAAELYSWLETGAHFYVCGDASRMAKDVEIALKDVIAVAGGKSAEQAEAYLQDLRAAKRYARDVY